MLPWMLNGTLKLIVNGPAIGSVVDALEITQVYVNVLLSEFSVPGPGAKARIPFATDAAAAGVLTAKAMTGAAQAADTVSVRRVIPRFSELSATATSFSWFVPYLSSCTSG